MTDIYGNIVTTNTELITGFSILLSIFILPLIVGLVVNEVKWYFRNKNNN